MKRHLDEEGLRRSIAKTTIAALAVAVTSRPIEPPDGGDTIRGMVPVGHDGVVDQVGFKELDKGAGISEKARLAWALMSTSQTDGILPFRFMHYVPRFQRVDQNEGNGGVGDGRDPLRHQEVSFRREIIDAALHLAGQVR